MALEKQSFLTAKFAKNIREDGEEGPCGSNYERRSVDAYTRVTLIERPVET